MALHLSFVGMFEQWYNFSREDTYLDTSAMIWYTMQYIITYNWQRRAAKNGWTMCFVCGCTRLCQLTTYWNCTCLHMHAKQYKATMELFPFYGSHCLIKSSERACTWVRSHKSQLFLNVESFIQTWRITIS